MLSCEPNIILGVQYKIFQTVFNAVLKSNDPGLLSQPDEPPMGQKFAVGPVLTPTIHGSILELK